MLHVVSDSSCDLPKELVTRHHVTEVPLSIDIDGAEYQEGVDITPAEFYAAMARSASLPKTSQPSPAAFAETFGDLSADGPVLCVTISSKLSGTYESARLGAELSGGDVTVFDSLAGSLGHGLQVLRACEMAEAGHTSAEVLAGLKSYRDEMRTLILLNTLENIVKGGRLSRFQGSLSRILDIRVLLHDDEGAVVMKERVHGARKLLERTVETVRELHPDLSDRDVGITHCDNLHDAELVQDAIADACHPRGFLINDMGSTMATYAGEGGMIVAF